MALRFLTFLVLLFGCVCAAPANQALETDKTAAYQLDVEDKDDLKTAASNTLTRRYADYGYPSSTYSGYGVTGYGTTDDRYNSYYGNGYDNTYGYGGSGGYGGGYGSGYSGYGGRGGYGGYGSTGYGSNGGYGGWGGNGGLNSYYGYNNPSYTGAYNLGYGYYNRRPGAGYGNIYNNGITPNLVTGYRGYSRR